MSSVDRAGPVTGTFSEKFQPGLRDEVRPKILVTNSGAKFWKQSKYDETQTYNLAPIIPLATLIAEWDVQKIQRAKQDDAISQRKIHAAFITVTGLKCSYGQIFGSASQVPVKKPSKPTLSYDVNTSKFRNPGLPGQPCSCEEALSSNFRVCK